MIKSLEKLLACAVLCFVASTVAAAAELADGQAIEKEAMSVANQYQSVASTIKAQGDTITALGEAHSVLNVSVVGTVKAIIQAIQLETQNLVNLIMREDMSANSKKLDVIMDKLESQRKALSSIISPQLESTPDVMLKPEDKKEVVKAFQVYEE